MAEQKHLADEAKIKDPDEWKTGDEPMTAAQRSYLETLSREAGEPVEEDMTKAETAKKIDELQEKTGRGKGRNTMKPHRTSRKKSSSA